MVFVPFVVDSDNTPVTVDIHRMRMSETEQTNHVPPWQTSWTSDYLMDDRFEKYAVVRGEELIALGAYEVQKASLIVHIVYLESQPASNPTIAGESRKYKGIGRLLIAFGIKLSAESLCQGVKVLNIRPSLFLIFCNS